MPPKSTAVAPIRLQTVKNLRVRNSDKKNVNPCMAPMTAMLSCWASSAGGNYAGCAALEKALKQCMDNPQKVEKEKQDFNHHLNRLWPQIRPPMKKK